MSLLNQVTQNNFDNQVLTNEKPVLVDFYADWCGPCRTQTPILEAVASEYAGKVDIVKLNVDQDAALSAQYNVRSIPTLILFKGGKPVNVQVGVSSARQLKTILDNVV
ncbi:thioredoxin [Saccharophagus sp. K07]|uniref:thioredoxin n=1 Tax=Saccharophagus sp. K07 TaxID=2283636 RepID=UPI001652455B|nr:thioredoxin [Saccharophagus sp. K07]MBC6906532.1 thioredoxin [Saccharophagus sp. K07]